VKRAECKRRGGIRKRRKRIRKESTNGSGNHGKKPSVNMRMNGVRSEVIRATERGGSGEKRGGLRARGSSLRKGEHGPGVSLHNLETGAEKEKRRDLTMGKMHRGR